LKLAGIILGPERHRRWSEAQKIKLVGETLLPGVTVAEVMARYSVSSSLIYTWRKQARLGLLGQMAPVGGQLAFAPVAIMEPQADVPSDNQICVATPQDLNPVPLQHDQINCEPVECAPNSDNAAMVVALPDGVRILVNNGVDEGALGKVLRALGR
jgi:transposase